CPSRSLPMPSDRSGRSWPAPFAISGWRASRRPHPTLLGSLMGRGSNVNPGSRQRSDVRHATSLPKSLTPPGTAWDACCVQPELTSREREREMVSASPPVSRAGNGPPDPGRAVSVISTGTVEIHPEHAFGTSKPLYWWLLTSRRWLPPLPINCYCFEHA